MAMGSGIETTAMRETRGIWGRVGAVLLSGPMLGVYLFAGLFLYSLLTYGGADYYGVKDTTVVNTVQQRFQAEIVRRQIEMLLLSIGIGFVLGALAHVTWSLIFRLFRRRPRLPLTAAARLLTVCAIHFYFFARSVLLHPQAYTDSLYDKGGWRRALQTVITDYTSLLAFNVIAAAFGLFLLVMGSLLLWRWRTESSMVAPRLSRLALAGVALLLVVPASFIFAGGKSTTGPRPTPARPNLIVIGVDSLRFDRLNRGGPRSGIAPTLDALAQRGTHFARAYTVMPRTFPAWISTLTGQYPHRHGIRHMFPGRANLARSRTTLASLLRSNGYRTAVISDFAGDIFSRIDAGYQDVRVPRFSLRQMIQLTSLKLHAQLLPYAVDVIGPRYFPVLKGFERLADPRWLTDDAIGWLRRRPSGRPFFLTLFYSTPHFPFSAPYPYYRAYTDDGYAGINKYHKAHFGKRPSDADVRRIRQLYDGCVWSVDREIGRLLAYLDEAGLREQTAIVLIADHGENLYERDYGVTHGEHLFGEYTIRIPMVLDFPGAPGRGKRIEEIVRNIDLTPTLLDLMGLRSPVKMDGVSLRPLLEGKPLALSAFVETGILFPATEMGELQAKTIRYTRHFEQFDYDQQTTEFFMRPSFEADLLLAKQRAVITGRYKLLYVPQRSGVDWFLFDLKDDPDESVNLVRTQPSLFGEMRRQLTRWVLTDPLMTVQGEFYIPRRGFAK